MEADNYEAFGLSIRSEIALPGLLRTGGKADVEIILEASSEKIIERDELVGRPGYLSLSIGGVGRFDAIGGNRITIVPNPGVAADVIRLYLLGSMLGAILIQRGFLLLHGCAVELNGVAVAFVGESGVGKSTLANAFRLLQGRRVLTDDICAIRFDAGSPILVSGYPSSKLWPDSATRLSLDLKSLPLIRENEEKRSIALGADFCSDCLPLAGVCFLERCEAASGVEIAPVVGAEKFAQLDSGTYRRGFHGPLGLGDVRFRHLAELARSVPTIRARVRLGLERLEEICSALENGLIPALNREAASR